MKRFSIRALFSPRILKVSMDCTFNVHFRFRNNILPFVTHFRLHALISTSRDKKTIERGTNVISVRKILVKQYFATRSFAIQRIIKYVSTVRFESIVKYRKSIRSMIYNGTITMILVRLLRIDGT